MQLNKFLAHTGVSSRRNAVELIKSGKVTVNGHIVTEPGYRVKETDMVKVDGKKIKVETKIYILLNKPEGYITTVSDEKGRQTVLDLVKPEIKQRVYPVGRLDRETTGVLLLTNDGELAQKLAHPKYEIKKTYQVILDKSLTYPDLQKIKEGIRLRDGMVRVDHVGFAPNKRENVVRVTLHSGKNRIVRRIFESLGYNVLELDRTKFAGITKERVRCGMWRFLTAGEVKLLREKVD